MMDKIVGQKDFAFRKLIAFADLKTERQCYTKGDVNVVIDSTDWGHRVGEIEIVVPDRDQVIQATKKIEANTRFEQSTIERGLVPLAS